jgi:DNA-binding NarL/FixJ family response regulator
LEDVHTIVVASDTAAIRRELISVLAGPDLEILEASSGQQVIELVKAGEIDLVIADIQMGAMGAIAVTLELRLEASYDEIDAVPVLMLLDRRADVFQAKRSGAEGWIVKPLDAIRIRRATKALLAGDRYEDLSYQPTPVLVGDEGA